MDQVKGLGDKKNQTEKEFSLGKRIDKKKKKKKRGKTSLLLWKHGNMKV